MSPSRATSARVAALLVALAVGSRLVDAAPNFAAVAAVSLFAGVFFSSRWAVLVPLLAMLISDALIGFYDARQMAVVYAMLCLPVLLRTAVAPVGRPIAMRVLSAAIMCSVAFFLFTNLAVWAFGPGYTRDLGGLVRCYTNALPFFRATLAGDLIYTAAIFGTHALVARRSTGAVDPAPATV